jgi:hypothetical protein
MRSDYRLHVVRTALSALPSLPDDFRSPIDRLTRSLVTVPGFRNSTKAPARVRAVPVADAFEKHPDLVAAVVSAWAEASAGLRQQVFDFLTARGWQLLPLAARREKLPGFFINWPSSEDFETLNKEFAALHPDSKATTDDVTLMVVWLGMRLPYKIVEEPVEEVTRLLDDEHPPTASPASETPDPQP